MMRDWLSDPAQILIPTAAHVLILAAAIGLVELRGRRRWTQWAVTAPLLLWAMLGTSPLVARYMTDALETQYAPAAAPERDTHISVLLIVLASGFTEATPTGTRARLDRAGWERTWGAVGAWRVLGGTLRFVGGPKADNAQAPATRMAEIAEALGVPREQIEVEDRSRDTHENIVFSADRIRRHRGPVWLVTSALHMPRAVAVARKIAADIHVWPCDYRSTQELGWLAIIPSAPAARANGAALHEFLGLWYYHVRGWI